MHMAVSASHIEVDQWLFSIGASLTDEDKVCFYVFRSSRFFILMTIKCWSFLFALCNQWGRMPLHLTVDKDDKLVDAVRNLNPAVYSVWVMTV